MRIATWNVNGLRSVHNKGLLLPFIEEYKPDILCLQETKAQQHQSEVDLPDYEEYWNSAVRKGYSGTAIFTRNMPKEVILGFPSHILDRFHMKSDGYGDPDSEGRLITAEYEDFAVVNVYTPNSKRDLSRLPLRHDLWDPAFTAYCKELSKKKPVIACGDFNVAHTPDDIANPKQNEGTHGYTKEERGGIDDYLKAGFIDAFRMEHQGNGHYTWWSPFANARARNVGWRLDYVFVSNDIKDKIKECKIAPEIMGSDHCPVVLDIAI
jgi:exodeoxyribonuclease-3